MTIPPRPTPACAAFADRLPLVAELTAAEAAPVHAHTRGCPYCQAVIRQYGALDRALIALDARPASHAPTTEDIMRFLTDHAPDLAAPSAPVAPPPRRRWASGLVAALSLALVALLALAIFARWGPGLGGAAGPFQSSLPGAQGMFAAVARVSPTEAWAFGQVAMLQNQSPAANEITFYHERNGVWTPQIVTTHTTFSLGGLNGQISMASATDGWAVAREYNGPATLFRYHAGVWSVFTVGAFIAVRAVAANAAWAITGETGAGTALARFDGTQWRAEPIIGLTNTATAHVISLEMIDENNGWALAAIGNATAPSKWSLLRYTAGQWLVADNIPGDTLTTFLGLGLDAAGDGWVIGERFGADASGDTTHVPPTLLALRTSGGQWTTTQLAAPAGGYTTITGVAFRPGATGDGWIFGQVTTTYAGATTSGYTQHTALWHLVGGVWTVGSLPTLGASVDAVTGVDIAPDGTALAVGYVNAIPTSRIVQSDQAAEGGSPLVLRWVNGGWSVVKLSA